MKTVAYERWWATYLKASAFLFPAIALWAATVIFIVPKLEQICADAGGQSLPALLRTMLDVTQHGMPLLGALLVALILIEWLSERWQKYRRVVTGLFVFLLNSVILAGFFTLLVTFAVVAPALVRVAK